tara:strand:+ start:22611 stop:23033 length:423 start_codon:yes stop_codon:yes gene_type:complete
MSEYVDKKWPIGLICGSFDVIHPGYIKMFIDANLICDKILIALQSDPSIDRPNKESPLQTPEEREIILRAIRYIDDIVHYTTEAELYNILKTDIYDVRILGSDYINLDYTGKNLNRPVYFHDRSHEYSTTKYKKNIRRKK